MHKHECKYQLLKTGSKLWSAVEWPKNKENYSKVQHKLPRFTKAHRSLVTASFHSASAAALIPACSASQPGGCGSTQEQSWMTPQFGTRKALSQRAWHAPSRCKGKLQHQCRMGSAESHKPIRSWGKRISQSQMHNYISRFMWLSSLQMVSFPNHRAHSIPPRKTEWCSQSTVCRKRNTVITNSSKLTINRSCILFRPNLANNRTI